MANLKIMGYKINVHWVTVTLPLKPALKIVQIILICPKTWSPEGQPGYIYRTLIKSTGWILKLFGTKIRVIFKLFRNDDPSARFFLYIYCETKKNNIKVICSQTADGIRNNLAEIILGWTSMKNVKIMNYMAAKARNRKKISKCIVESFQDYS